MKKIIYGLLLAFLGMSFPVYAQSITKDQEKQMQVRAAQKVGQLTRYIELIGNKTESLEYRLYYRGAALKLFIGQGDSYDEIRIDASGRNIKIERAGVLMQVTSVNKKSKADHLVRDYLRNLANLKYSAVKIQTTDIAHMKVSKLQKVGSGTYKCICYFKQSFVGYREGRPVYADITEKKVECIIFEEATIDGVEYIIRLGDVTALETRKMDANTSAGDILNILNQ